MKEAIKTIVCDLGGVLIKLNVPRCIEAFEALMGKDNLRNVLGMDEEGEGVKSVSVASRQLMADFERGLIKSADFIEQIRSYCHPDTTDEMVQNAWMAMLGDLPQERLEQVYARSPATGSSPPLMWTFTEPRLGRSYWCQPQASQMFAPRCW